MGSTEGKFKEEHMKEFEATTPFNRAEIYHAFKIFQQLYDTRATKPDDKPLFLTEERHVNLEAAVSIEHICEKLPALRVNPFKQRMCEIFSVSDNGMMTFVEFLDMTSAFSPKTSTAVTPDRFLLLQYVTTKQLHPIMSPLENSIQQKIFHAFQIFDEDGDGIISPDDLTAMLDKITDKGIGDDQKDIIIATVFDEVNKECTCDGLSTEDFHYAISRSPDFASTFSFRL